MYILGLIVLSFFAIVGLLCFIRSVLRRVGGYDEKLALVLEELTVCDAEVRVRNGVSLCEELRIEELRCECRDREARIICEKLRREYPMIAVDIVQKP